MTSEVEILQQRLEHSSLNRDDRIDIYNKLTQLLIEKDLDQSLDYALKLLKLLQEIENDKKIAVLYNFIGIIYTKKNQFQKSLEYYKKSLDLMNKVEDAKGKAISLCHMGIIYSRLGNYQEAFRVNFESLKIEENAGNKHGIAKNLNNIGILYKDIRNYEKALEYNQRALEIFDELDSQLGRSYSYNNIGIIYKNMNDYEKALKYYFLSLEINEKINDQNGIANAFNNIGICYKYLNVLDKSIDFFVKGLEIRENMHDERGISTLKKNIAEDYLMQGNNKLALSESLHALEIAKKLQAKPIIKDCYNLISRIYSQDKNFEKALEFYKLYCEFKDEIYDEESSKKIAEMQTRYETEKKEREAEIYRLKNFELEEKVKERTEELRKANLQLQIEIEEHKQAQIQIKKDLEEKKILLQELYHRTKNNMQLISSLLKMQSETSNDEFVHATFETINNRIKAMSLVQQKLYQAKELSIINLREYIEDVVNMLRRSFITQSSKISLKLKLSKVFVIVDSAVPLGLVLNELITNCYKHAFPDNRLGEIKIQMFETNDEMITILIEDNGIGFPKDYNPKEADSIGFQTIYSLVEYQLKGTVKYKCENGLSWEIKFKNDNQSIRI